MKDIRNNQEIIEELIDSIDVQLLLSKINFYNNHNIDRKSKLIEIELLKKSIKLKISIDDFNIEDLKLIINELLI